MIPSIQITGTSHEPESYTLVDAATTGAIALPDTSLVDLKNIVLPVDFTISTLDRYIGKRVLIEKPQDTTGIAINIIAPIPFSGSGIPFPLSTTYTLPDGALSLELVFGSTDYISISNTGTVPVIPIPGTTTRELYVSINGSDTNTGNALYPLQTIQKAIDTVTGFGDATVTTQYKILCAGGQYNENLTLVPFINILSLSGDETSVSLNGSLDPSGLDIPQATFTISNFKFMQNPNWNTSGFGNALYIRFIECEFASGSNMDITQNNISIIGFLGCTIECDKCFWHTGGYIFSNTRGLNGTGYIEFDDTSGLVEVYFMNTTFIKADTHLKCSANIGAIYHIADSYFEQSLRIDNDTSQMTVYFDRLPFQNNFDSITTVNFSRVSDCFGDSYSPTDPADWPISVPNNVRDALDNISYTVNNTLYRLQNNPLTAFMGFFSLSSTDIVSFGITNITMTATTSSSYSTTVGNMTIIGNANCNIISLTQNVGVSSARDLILQAQRDANLLANQNISVNASIQLRLTGGVTTYLSSTSQGVVVQSGGPLTGILLGYRVGGVDANVSTGIQTVFNNVSFTTSANVPIITPPYVDAIFANNNQYIGELDMMLYITATPTVLSHQMFKYSIYSNGAFYNFKITNVHSLTTIGWPVGAPTFVGLAFTGGNFVFVINVGAGTNATCKLSNQFTRLF